MRETEEREERKQGKRKGECGKSGILLQDEQEREALAQKKGIPFKEREKGR